jgi:hypothetical protein
MPVPPNISMSDDLVSHGLAELVDSGAPATATLPFGMRLIFVEASPHLKQPGDPVLYTAEDPPYATPLEGLETYYVSAVLDAFRYTVAGTRFGTEINRPSVTFSIRAADGSILLNWTSHGLFLNDTIRLMSESPLPAGVTNQSFVAGVTGVNTVQLKLTVGGSIITWPTATLTAGTPGTVTLAGHGLAPGARVSFAGGTLPAEVVANQSYFVHTVVNASTFTIAAAVGGAAIAFASSGVAPNYINAHSGALTLAARENNTATVTRYYPATRMVVPQTESIDLVMLNGDVTRFVTSDTSPVPRLPLRCRAVMQGAARFLY